jgi:phage terminase large subunit
MSFQTTTAQSKIARLRKRIRIVQGGTSSSKTFSIIPLLISYAIENPMSEISIVSESIPHLKRGAIKDFQKIMILCDLYKDSQFNKSDLKYRFKNGSYIEFFSVDQPDKLRGARRDILFVNECNNIDFESYQQLSVRTKKFIYLDYNPTNEFWVHTELMNDIDTDFVVLTYKDNEALDGAIVKEIEKAREKAKTSSYWENWWKVYGLGQLGSLEGVIFNNWQIIDNIPNEATLLGFGLDFGFSNDPSSLIAVFQWNDKIICDERIYATGLLNTDIIRLMNQDKRLPIWADSAEPKSIEEIRRAGFNIKSVEKGKDSIVYGISVLQDKDILVTKSSVNLIKELRSYSWDTDKAGKKLNKPIDDFNHGIDALRYFAMMHFKNSNRRFKIT